MVCLNGAWTVSLERQLGRFEAPWTSRDQQEHTGETCMWSVLNNSNNSNNNSNSNKVYSVVIQRT
jgi:hypothetical protein